MARSSLDTRALFTLAATQAGVVSRQQAQVCGATNYVIQKRLDSGAWVERLGCFVVSRSLHSTDLQDAYALALRLGPDVVITGPTALRLRHKKISSDILLAVVPRNRNSRIEGVRLLRDEAHRKTIQGPGFRIACPEDAFIDTLIAVDAMEARRLLDESLQLHQIVTDDWLPLIDARSGRTGVSQLRRLRKMALEGTHSHGEREMKALLKRAGLQGWVANHQLHVNGRLFAELDFALLGLKICIEVDGRAFHSDDKAFQRDRDRQNQLIGLGWLVLRFTWEQITKTPDRVITQIQAAIVQRQHQIAVG